MSRTRGIIVIRLQGLFELVGVLGFLIGFFLNIGWLLIAGGCLIVFDDLIEITLGILNPVFPLLLTIVLAFLLTPWYLGVFWASAAFKGFNVPASLKKVATRHALVNSYDEQ